MEETGISLEGWIGKAGAAAHDDAVRTGISKAVRRGGAPELKNAEAAEQVARNYELAMVEFWKSALDAGPEDLEKNRALVRMCRKCFGMMEACPIPGEPAKMITHVLKILAYAYLGEKWEGARRYLKENKRVWDVAPAAEKGWDRRVLAHIYLAILHVTRKETREDLEQSARIMGEMEKGRGTYEKEYLEKTDDGDKLGAARELAALYQLAKAVGLVSTYMRDGSPADVEERLDTHFQKAEFHSSGAGTKELDILLAILNPAFKKMVRNSVWTLARLPGRQGRFARMMMESSRPVFELLYPQRLAMLEKGLLGSAKAVVASLPASSDKTTMAEFRILQALESARGGVAAYVVPSEALASQITARLRRDLGAPPLGVRVEKAGGAPHVDGFEEEMVSGEADLDVLVTTPEKLHLLIRSPGSRLAESLVLAVIDGADCMSGGAGGLGPEMLLSTIKHDCARSDILLMAASVPNGREIAKWLDPQNSRSIGADPDWRPGDRVVGLFRAEGRGRSIETFFRPLATGAWTVSANGEFRVGSADGFALPAGKVKDTRYALASLLATQFDPSRNLLVLGRGPGEAWKMADLICRSLPEPEPDGERLLARKFVASELGAGFPLVKYLDRGVGVCHAGLPDEVREVMERLMEGGRLRVLAATTSIARGMDFPVSGIIMASHSYPSAEMPARDFWNLADRAGRIGQPPMGVVGLATGNPDDGIEAEYVKEAAKELTSALTGMVHRALDEAGGGALDLSRLAEDDAGWSGFAQYIAHMKNRIPDMGRFVEEAEFVLGRTYGYRKLPQKERHALADAVRKYAERLYKNPLASRLSGLTGFSPETLGGTMRAVRSAGIGRGDWNAGSLFAPASERLSALVGVMAESIPEVKKSMDIPASGRISTEGMGGVISDWVSGVRMAEIAEARFGRSGAGHVTERVGAICGIAAAAARGMDAVQRMPGSGLDFEGMTREQRSALNLPAMVYHGVDSDGAVLMRMYGVPRGAARRVGEAYAREARDVRAGASGVLSWLEELPDKSWGPGSGATMSGAEYKEVWRRLAGAVPAAGGRDLEAVRLRARPSPRSLSARSAAAPGRNTALRRAKE